MAKKTKRAGKAAENYDVRATSVVRRLATVESKDGVLAGFVPRKTIAWCYAQAVALAAEVVKPTLGFAAPPLAISVEKISKKQMGHYKPGRDGLGLRWRIVLNILFLGRPKWTVAHTILHETLHAVQHDQGKKTKAKHDEQFRGWCEQLGIPCDKKGAGEDVVKDSPFARYLRRHRMDGKLQLVAKGHKPPKAAGSPLKKWSCPCGQNARVAIPDFSAVCGKCEGEFVLQEAA